ncbi:MAG: cytochrome C biogenesis protein [Acidobacteria bacterium]|nr:MAG: cytochrome C biogenesis protein [Acidobacteriota bacterium]
MNHNVRGSLIAVLFLFAGLHLYSQDSSIFKWNISSKRLGDGKYELIFSTPVDNGWQLYSASQIVPDLNTTEIKFDDSAIIQDKVLSEKGKLKEIASPVFDNARVKVYEGKTEWRKTITIAGLVPAKLQGDLNYSYGRNDEFYTGTFPFIVSLEGGIVSTTRIRIPTIDINRPVNNCGDNEAKDKSMIGIFILGLLGGFIALFTPCVFPMIPLTVSFFTRAESRRKGILNAFIYGFSIFLIYVLLSLPFHIFHASPQVLNNFSTNVSLNIFFFFVFIIFAISFFGYFDITLPGSFANKTSSHSGLNAIGIFFMAFTLAIVSFSCTGPILGSLLAGTAARGSWPLTAGLAGFGLALALPFTTFAVFPNWLRSLPKSGAWLNSVKVVLGFLEIAMAIKFLSNADLVKQWGLLRRETFMALWIIIGCAIVLYLFGKIRFPHDSPERRFSSSRIAFIGLFSLVTVYLLPGVTNTKWANLKLISGFPPPMCYSIYSNPVNCKRGFEPLREYDVALEKARREDKPILIDFTGWACVNCRRMEEAVWTDPSVDSLMEKEFVVVSLYVDEKRKLPLQQQTVYISKDGSEKSITTIGDEWSNFQIENFNATSQPQYAIVGTDEAALTRTKGYTPSPEKFADWLKCGLNAFKMKSK